MTRCSITDMSGRANSPPLNAAIGVVSPSGSMSIDMPRGGRPLVIAKSIPACLSFPTAAMARSVRTLSWVTSVPSTSARRSLIATLPPFHAPRPTSGAPAVSIEREKQAAAEAAADLVEHHMTVGLGTGTTVAFLLPALARRSLDILCAATSPRTEHAARELGLRMEDLDSIDRFDITIDGADQITPDGWLVKGGGGAHTREKIVAAAADRFVVIADSTKPVEALHS